MPHPYLGLRVSPSVRHAPSAFSFGGAGWHCHPVHSSDVIGPMRFGCLRDSGAVAPSAAALSALSRMGVGMIWPDWPLRVKWFRQGIV